MNKPEFYINHLYPSAENAKAMIDLRYGDLRHIGLSVEQTDKLADSENQGHVERQIKDLEDYPERYLGAIALKSGDLVGYSNISEWTVRDCLPYVGNIERLALRAMAKVTDNHLIGRPLGVHELVVVDDVHSRKEIVDTLLARAIDVAETREVYTAQYDDEIVLYSLYQNGFQITRNNNAMKDGSKKLYVRPFPFVEPDYGYEKGMSKTIR